MGKNCILITDCSSGDIIAQKIVSKYGATVAVENTIINDYIINKLKAFEVDYIWVYKSSDEEAAKLSDNNLLNIKKNYKHNVIEISSLINDLSKGNQLEEEKMNGIVNSIYSSLDKEYYIIKCINELKAVDQYLYNHSVNVSFYSMLLGKWLGLNKSDIKKIVQAALLHDIGKAQLAPNILNKSDKLEPSEYYELIQHPIYGYNLVKNSDFISEAVKEAILTHHEHIDKSGYPFKKSGDELNIYSKIISVVDIYDGITSERPYARRLTPFEAFQVIANDNLGRFDIHIMGTFLGNLAACYVGSKVLLNNSEVGEIVYVPPQSINKPTISVNSRYIDLSKESDIKIISML
jgi:putative nucleotidyltransferase with HDIG domain